MEDNSKLEIVVHDIEEGSYKYLEYMLKHFIKTLYENSVNLKDLFTEEELLKLFMIKFYESYKDVIENLLTHQDKFYKLLIEAGRDKSLLVTNIGEIKLKTTVDFSNAGTLGKSLHLITEEYIYTILSKLRDRVIYLINEYNELNPDKKYSIKGLNLIDLGNA